ncbi:UNVERIFIED_CONTAM: putative late blight resistance proteinR1A-10 [Sesamum radiatum]|uniref:Late blight resistance proteinR1A-10 n=1 Tax=Sesamum radiatum TaxID=300843 RepID=A0AAW2PK77_SESRA
MAVAAYASLLSLIHVLDNVQHPARCHQIHLDTNQIRSLQEKLQFLQDFLEVHDSQSRSLQEMEDLARQIADAANKAEVIIDLHVVDQLRKGSKDHESDHIAAFYQDIDKVIRKVDCITKELMIIKEEWDDVRRKKPAASVPANSSRLPSSNKNSTIVGFEDDLKEIMHHLITKDYPDRWIIPIVGLGGSGKTTLAKSAFNDPRIVDCFSIRSWFTVSQEYNARKILLGLLGDGKIEESGETLTQLGERLHKKLFGERYLIVLDDLWSAEIWNDLKFFFPNNRGSRILVTTRLHDVAASLNSHYKHTINPLNMENSWILLCEKVFAKKYCPSPILEYVGKEIAQSCKGHPLATLVVGGLLKNSDMSIEYWSFIENSLRAPFRFECEEYDYWYRILVLCYNYLPIHLKPCFLYMGVFPEDHRIEVSELTKLWVGEGFLKPVRGKTLEEVANEYLEDLVARNLILLHERTSRGKLKVCGIHDLLRDLCLEGSKKEHLFHVPKVQRINLFKGMGKMCFLCSDRFSLQEGMDVQALDSLRSTSVAGGLVCNACKIMYPDLTRLRLMKVFGRCCHEQHTELRYIDIRAPHFWDRVAQYELDFASPSTIHLLWNLQTLCIDSGTSLEPIALPSKIWEMPQLRHVMVKLASLPDFLDTQDATVLENLQTLSFIHNLRCAKETLEKIPNLKKLKVCYSGNLKDWSYYCVYNLVHLRKLESLYLITKDLLSEKIAFPTSLKKLTLSGCKLPWEDMKFIGFTLHNLEVLKLYNNAFKGPEWNPVEGQFRQLKVLSIWFSDLVWWRAKAVHFPDLKCLVLGYMNDLEEIPSDFAGIPTLRSIHLNECSDSVVNSAKQILEEQWDIGNEAFQVHVDEDGN